MTSKNTSETALDRAAFSRSVQSGVASILTAGLQEAVQGAETANKVAASAAFHINPALQEQLFLNAATGMGENMGAGSSHYASLTALG